MRYACTVDTEPGSLCAFLKQQLSIHEQEIVNYQFASITALRSTRKRRRSLSELPAHFQDDFPKQRRVMGLYQLSFSVGGIQPFRQVSFAQSLKTIPQAKTLHRLYCIAVLQDMYM